MKYLATIAALCLAFPTTAFATNRVEKVVVKEKVIVKEVVQQVQQVRFVDRVRAAVVFPTQTLAIVNGCGHVAQFNAPYYAPPVQFVAPNYGQPSQAQVTELEIQKLKTKQEEQKTEQLRLQLQAK